MTLLKLSDTVLRSSFIDYLLYFTLQNSTWILGTLPKSFFILFRLKNLFDPLTAEPSCIYSRKWLRLTSKSKLQYLSTSQPNFQSSSKPKMHSFTWQNAQFNYEKHMKIDLDYENFSLEVFFSFSSILNIPTKGY